MQPRGGMEPGTPSLRLNTLSTKTHRFTLSQNQWRYGYIMLPYYMYIVFG